MTLDASQTGANVTLIGNNQGNQILVGGSGDDTVTAGAGTNDILFGGSGTTAYRFGSSFGQDTVNNAGSANTPAGEIDFGSGITDQNLWFQQSGNDLVIDRLGTSDGRRPIQVFIRKSCEVSKAVPLRGMRESIG